MSQLPFFFSVANLPVVSFLIHLVAQGFVQSGLEKLTWLFCKIVWSTSDAEEPISVKAIPEHIQNKKCAC